MLRRWKSITGLLVINWVDKVNLPPSSFKTDVLNVSPLSKAVCSVSVRTTDFNYSFWRPTLFFPRCYLKLACKLDRISNCNPSVLFSKLAVFFLVRGFTTGFHFSSHF